MTDLASTDGLLMIDLSASALTPDERSFLLDTPVGGVCLFARNIEDRFQLADYVSELRELAGNDLIVATDQEGGGVVRILDLPYPPGAMALGAAGDPELTRRVAAATGRGLGAVGITVAFAPVADLDSDPDNPVIADRAFGADPERAAVQVAAFVTGLQSQGVAATAKHFPGHGDTRVDSHLALPRIGRDLEELRRRELVPFAAALRAGAAAVMPGHLLVPAVDPERPATFSPALLRGLLRGELGFEGTVFSDALDMRAVAERYDAGEAAARALAAGVDMPVTIGPLAQHRRTVAALRAARAAGRLDDAELGVSRLRLARLARDFPARPDPERAWNDGDEELLREAAARALLPLGDPAPLPPGSRLALVAPAWERQSAASQLTARPALRLAALLEEAGHRVERRFFDPERPLERVEAVLAELTRVDVALFVSSSRTPLSEQQRELGRRVATAAPRYLHLALWNPHHVAALPGPAWVSFGFRERSLRALVEALARGTGPGSPPTPLAPAGDEATPS